MLVELLNSIMARWREGEVVGLMGTTSEDPNKPAKTASLGNENGVFEVPFQSWEISGT